MGEVHNVRWLLDDDGGGVVKVFIDYGAHTVEHRYVFKSFDELPDYVADSIRQDGRIAGEITTTGVSAEWKTEARPIASREAQAEACPEREDGHLRTMGVTVALDPVLLYGVSLNSAPDG